MIGALRDHLDEDGEFVDPFLQKTFRSQGLRHSRAGRLPGVGTFTGIDDRQAPVIGLALPEFTQAQRAYLLRQPA